MYNKVKFGSVTSKRPYFCLSNFIEKHFEILWNHRKRQQSCLQTTLMKPEGGGLKSETQPPPAALLGTLGKYVSCMVNYITYQGLFC